MNFCISTNVEMLEWQFWGKSNKNLNFWAPSLRMPGKTATVFGLLKKFQKYHVLFVFCIWDTTLERKNASHHNIHGDLHMYSWVACQLEVGTSLGRRHFCAT